MGIINKWNNGKYVDEGEKVTELYFYIWLYYMHKNGKTLILTRIEEWLVKLMEFAEMAKLTFLWEGELFIFIANWKLFLDFLHEKKWTDSLWIWGWRGRIR